MHQIFRAFNDRKFSLIICGAMKQIWVPKRISPLETTLQVPPMLYNAEGEGITLFLLSPCT